jgi:transcription elongation GreA/GreB family factor
MWVVGIIDKAASNGRKWHFLPQDDAVLLFCGLRNPPWYFRWDGEAWHETGQSAGLAVGKRCDAETLEETRSLPADSRCAICRRGLEEAIAIQERDALVSRMLAAGKVEVTVDTIVTIRDTATGEDIVYCFDGCSSPPDDALDCTRDSALGLALLGRFVGDETTVYTPTGITRFAIVKAVSTGSDRVTTY